MTHHRDRTHAQAQDLRAPKDADFALPPPDPAGPHRHERLSPRKRRTRLAELAEYLHHQQASFLGYQSNQQLNGLDEELRTFLTVHANNVGDPFKDGNFTAHTKWLERSVLHHFAELWHAKPYTAGDLESAWGYLLTMGSSEGNVYALLNARDYLSGKVLMADRRPTPSSITADAGAAHGPAVPRLLLGQGGVPAGRVHPDPVRDEEKKANYYRPVAFFSEDTHYSVAKAAHTLNIPTFAQVGNAEHPGRCPLTQHLSGGNKGVWPTEVPSVDRDAGPGTIDIDALATLVEYFAERGHPILVVCNLGSTFKGAYDDVGAVAEKLQPIFERHGLDNRPVALPPDAGLPQRSDWRAGYWIHVDGALGASYLPYLAQAAADRKLKDNDIRVPRFDFAIPQVSSIVTSGHKYPGAPWPCGVYMTRQKLQLQPPPDPAYIGSPDTTFAGSRNAFSAIVLWNRLAGASADDRVQEIVDCEEVARYAFDRLVALDRKFRERGEQGIDPARTGLSLSLRFRLPNARIVHRYSLCHVPLLTADGVRKDFCHLYVMPHVTRELIDALLEDLAAEGAFPRLGPAASEAASFPAHTEDEWGHAHLAIDLARGFR